MSIAILSLAVVAVGQQQVQPARAEEPNYFAFQPQGKSNKKAVKPILASKLPAPKDLTKRGIWLKNLLKEVGFKGDKLKTAWAVAMKESTGRPLAYNGNTSTGDNSYGIFQINMIGELGVARRDKFGLKSNKELYNPLTNAEIAYYMTRGGEDWSSWDIDSSGYNGGVSRSRYLEWLARYPKG
jgi:hypothetical protein